MALAYALKAEPLYQNIHFEVGLRVTQRVRTWLLEYINILDRLLSFTLHTPPIVFPLSCSHTTAASVQPNSKHIHIIVKMSIPISLPSFGQFLRALSQPIRTEPPSPASGRRSSTNNLSRESTTLSTQNPRHTGCAGDLLLEQAPSQQSWFQPESCLARRAFNHVKYLSIGQLYDLFWQIDPERPLYGAVSAVKAPIPAVRPASMSLNKWQQQQQHKYVETERRDRARRCQNISHAGTCELANLMAGDVAECLGVRSVSKPTKAKSSTKAPGKDDQLVASIAMQQLSGIVVRSEHAGRLAAERRVAELEDHIRRLDAQSRAPLQDSPPPRKRGNDFGAPTHLVKRQRLPPSPSLSPCLTHSPSSTTHDLLRRRQIAEA